MQKITIKLLISLLLGIMMSPLYAEQTAGDRSNVFKVSSIRILNKAEVSIFSERVNIKVEGNYCKVRVSYEFWNNQEQDLPIECGLPIYYMSSVLGEDVFNWETDYVTDFKVWLEDGQAVSVTDRTDPQIWNDSLYSEGRSTPIRTKRKMYLANFTMPKVTSKTVNVEYKVKSYYRDVKGPQAFIPKYHSRVIQYDFTPALTWGKGTIRDFSMVLDCGEIPKDFIHVFGVGFNKLTWQDGYYVLNQTDFPINKYSIMHVEYDYNISVLNEFINTYRIPQDRLLRTKVSSQADIYYGVENLYDRNFGTVWAEGSNHQGVGEFVEIILDDYQLSAIAIINGFPKTEDDYYENCRLAKVKIERQYIDANNVIRTDVQTADVKYESYRKVNEKNFSKLLTVIADYGNGQVYKVRKLKITILEVHPGTKFDKTCISEMFLLGKE